MTQKLRKERGQNLDAFICTFMQSIEQSTDVGEDVIEMKEPKIFNTKHPPGHSSIFGDLFGMKTMNKKINPSRFVEQRRWIRGPCQCLVYICEYDAELILPKHRVNW